MNPYSVKSEGSIYGKFICPFCRTVQSAGGAARSSHLSTHVKAGVAHIIRRSFRGKEWLDYQPTNGEEWYPIFPPSGWSPAPGSAAPVPPLKDGEDSSPAPVPDSPSVPVVKVVAAPKKSKSKAPTTPSQVFNRKYGTLVVPASKLRDTYEIAGEEPIEVEIANLVFEEMSSPAFEATVRFNGHDAGTVSSRKNFEDEYSIKTEFIPGPFVSGLNVNPPLMDEFIKVLAAKALTFRSERFYDIRAKEICSQKIVVVPVPEKPNDFLTFKLPIITPKFRSEIADKYPGSYFLNEKVKVFPGDAVSSSG